MSNSKKSDDFAAYIRKFSFWGLIIRHPYRGSEMEWPFRRENSRVRSPILDRGSLFEPGITIKCPEPPPCGPPCGGFCVLSFEPPLEPFSSESLLGKNGRKTEAGGWAPINGGCQQRVTGHRDWAKPKENAKKTEAGRLGTNKRRLLAER